MTKKIITVVLIVIWRLLLIQVSAQQSNGEKIKIAAIARPYKDSVLLRWAPGSSSAWQVLNKEGYYIKRMRFKVDGKVTSVPYFKLLTKEPLKPWALEKWKPYVDSGNRYGTIAAQALYSEDFEVSRDKIGNISGVVSTINQNEQRYSFALFCADQSFEVAKAMGLGFVDKEVKANETYIYHIYAAGSDKLIAIDTTELQVAYSKNKPLPKVTGVKAKADESTVLVNWDLKAFTGIYTWYKLERSTDGGKTFVNTSDVPVINSDETNVDELEKGTQIDTISAINRRIVYRVKGITPFGEAGPPSDTVVATAIYKLNVNPLIKETVEEKGVVKISWEMPESKAIVLGFDIERSSFVDKGFVKINLKTLSAQTRSFTDSKPLDVNFYRVKAYGKEGIKVYSLSHMIQMPDSIPPAPPVNISGTVNKSGVVQLKWNSNMEPDLFGYRVYRSNSEKGEYSQVTKEPLFKSAFTDTITLKTLTRNVFYKLVALDKRYNPSSFSKVFKLKRPDIIPPTPPVFTSFKALPEGVFLSWYNSSSDDVVRHDLLRTADEKEDWKIIKSYSDTTKNFLDGSAQIGQKYRYKLVATDEANLMSESQPFSAKRMDLGLKPDIESFSALADRDKQQIVLKWNYKQTGIKHYLIYRSEAKKPLHIYKMIEPKINTFEDTQLFINNLYEYHIKAVFADGTETRISKGVVVNY